MNPHAARPVSPIEISRSLVKNRGLLYDLVKREIAGRYRGSTFGILWSFFNPVLMLSVYTFVFSVVFEARWLGGSNSKTEFAMVLFSGLMAFNLFAENINRSPSLIISNANYVKKVVFPLEILPFVTLGSAFFHFSVSWLVWMVFHLIFLAPPPITVLLLPIALTPLIFLSLGLAWFFSSLGVFLRDIGQVIAVFTMALMYLTPIFYPASVVPPKYQNWMALNPLTANIEQVRNVMSWGLGIDWRSWLWQMILGAAVAWLGFIWFQKTRPGFSDVV